MLEGIFSKKHPPLSFSHSFLLPLHLFLGKLLTDLLRMDLVLILMALIDCVI